MKYVLSGFRTPKPGSLPDLINGAVDFYKGVDFPGMVTVAPTIPVVATHRPFEAVSYTHLTLPTNREV